MKYRDLGATGLKVSELGLGCSSLGNSVFNYGDESEFLKVLNYAFENGINFFDTADTYALGNSEILIGKAFQNKRDKIILATKVGFIPSSLSRSVKNLIPFIGSARKLISPFKKSLKRLSKRNQDFSSEHIRQSIEKSLTRLKTDYIDIYQLHNPPADVIKEGHVFKLLDDLKTQGKIRYYGVSAATIDDAVLCLNVPGISSLQIEFNLLHREAAAKLFTLLKRNQRGIIVRVPLARGLLTDKAKVQTGSFSCDSNFNSKQTENLQTLQAEMNKKKFPEAALRFILDFPEVSTVIAGTKSVNHLKENLQSLSHPSFTLDEFEKISLSLDRLEKGNIYDT